MVYGHELPGLGKTISSFVGGELKFLKLRFDFSWGVKKKSFFVFFLSQHVQIVFEFNCKFSFSSLQDWF